MLVLKLSGIQNSFLVFTDQHVPEEKSNHLKNKDKSCP